MRPLVKQRSSIGPALTAPQAPTPQTTSNKRNSNTQECGLFDIKADNLAHGMDILAELCVWHKDCSSLGENVYNASSKAYNTPTAPAQRKWFNLGSGNRPAKLGD